MRSRPIRLLSSLALMTAITGCYGSPVDAELDEFGDPSSRGDDIRCGTPPVFDNNPADPDDHCSPAEQVRIMAAWNTVVQPQMCQATPRAALTQCLREARFSPSREAYAEEIIRRLGQNLPTHIRCKTLPPNVNAEAPIDHAPELLTFNHTFLTGDSDPNTPGVQLRPPARVASVLLHEVAHNKGYRHYRETGEEYEHSVNEQVEFCSLRVSAGAAPALPHGAPRASGVLQEAELQPFGDPGDSDGARFFTQCPAGTVVAGQQVGLNALGVAGLRVWCRPALGGVPTPVGIGADNALGVQTMCPPGQVAVGLRARATDRMVRSVGFSCRPWAAVVAATPSVLTDLTLPANAPLPPPLEATMHDNLLRRTCPTGMLITALAGSLDGSMEQLRVWCGTASFGTGGAYNTTIDNVTFDPTPSTDRRSHEERCAESGALHGLFGSSRGGAVVRMGGYCRGMRRVGAGYTLLGEHLLSTGGDGPTSDTFEARCPGGTVARGFEARPAPTGRGVGALRLLCSAMTPNAPMSAVLVTGAWANGAVQSRVCPPGQRLVGLRASSAAYGLPVPVGRVVDRLAPICRVFPGT